MRLSATRWTWVDAVRRGEEGALQSFVAKYRPAVYGYFCARIGDAEAEDLSQEVFLRVFADRVLERADRTRGKLRSLLFAVARNVLGRHLEHTGARKRGGGAQHLSLEDRDAEAEEEHFDRQWLLYLLEQALIRLRASHPRYHDVLRRCLSGAPRSEVAEALGESPANVKSLLHRGKQRLRAHLLELVTEYASSREDFEAELRTLGQLLPD